MQTRKLGHTDLEITLLGFGAWALGGGGWHASWGPQDDQESIAAIHHAIERGINWIDTAAIYGYGHSEEVVGRAIEGMSEKPLIFTKCARVLDENGKPGGNLNGANIRRELEGSLKRLKVDMIDLYQIHWPEPDSGIEEGWSTLAALQKEGKVRWIGVSNFNVAQLQRAQAIAPVGSLQPPYSAIRRDVENDILPYCRENGIGVIVYSPMQSGLLSGTMTAERIAAMPEDDWRRRNPEFTEPRLSHNLALVERMRAIGARHGRSAGEVAIAWTLANPAVTGAIVGLRNPAQVDGVIGAADLQLSNEEKIQIDEWVKEA